MDVLEFTGKTVDEAINKALAELQLTRNDIEVTVIEEASKGFLGFGAKNARIRVNRPDEVKNQQSRENEGVASTSGHIRQEKMAEEEVSEECNEQDKQEQMDPEELAIAYLAPLFKSLKVSPTIHVEENDEEISFSLSGEDVGILIGRRGETLDALQFILSLAINRQTKVHKRVLLDCEDYRVRRAETLRRLAYRMADKAVDSRRRVSLEPMNAAERRLVHLALDGREDIKVESYGEEPNRHIVIYPRQSH